MTFLLGQIATCLLLAFMAGFVLGWLARELSRDEAGAASTGYADGYVEIVADAESSQYRRAKKIQTVVGEVD